VHCNKLLWDATSSCALQQALVGRHTDYLSAHRLGACCSAPIWTIELVAVQQYGLWSLMQCTNTDHLVAVHEYGRSVCLSTWNFNSGASWLLTISRQSSSLVGDRNEMQSQAAGSDGSGDEDEAPDPFRCVAIHCNKRPHTATRCNTLQHTAIYCNILQHTAARCNTLQHAATHCNTLQNTATYCNTLHHTAPHCNTHYSIRGEGGARPLQEQMCEKSPTSPQKSHTSPQKSPIHNRAIHLHKRALHLHKRALHLHKRALSSTSPQKSPTSPQKSHKTQQKSPPFPQTSPIYTHEGLVSLQKRPINLCKRARYPGKKD